MELKSKKYIKNTKQLPGFNDGRFTGIKDISNMQNRISNLNNSYIPYDDISMYFGNDPEIDNIRKMSRAQLRNQVGLNNASSSASTGASIGDWGGAIVNTAKFGVDVVNSLQHDYSMQKELEEAGKSEGSVNGVSYLRQNRVDRDAIERQIEKQNIQTTGGLVVSGATAGAGIGTAIEPGLGTVIGGLGGALVGLGAGFLAGGKNHNERMKAVRKAEIQAGRINNLNRSGALTTAMQQDYYKTYGDTNSQSLYGAKNGKISSARGPIDAKATARVSNGEIIANKYDGTMYRVPGSKNNKDSKLAAIKDSDTIVTNKYGLSDYVAATGDVEGAEYMMKLMKDKDQLIRACGGKLPKMKCGKLPKHGEGWVPNVVSSGLGLLGGALQYMDAAGQEIKTPNTYVSNPYEQRALNDLYSLQVNPYPIMPELYNQYAKAMAAIDRSGGLSGGQRALARMAAMNNTQQNTSKMLVAAQNQNNAYKAQAAQAAISAGSQTAQRRMAANQYDLDYYSKAHAAQQQGKQMGMYNMLNALQSYYANDFKRRQFNDTMDLYRQQLSLDKQRMLIDIANQDAAKSIKTPLAWINPWIYQAPLAYYGGTKTR